MPCQAGVDAMVGSVREYNKTVAMAIVAITIRTRATKAFSDRPLMLVFTQNNDFRSGKAIHFRWA
jgi:hypothetical protein